MHFEKIQLVQVQSGRQSAIIHFYMAVIYLRNVVISTILYAIFFQHRPTAIWCI